METFKPKPGTIEIDNSDFKLSRSFGIGGSDFENLLQESPYSCIRKLFYEKQGRVPDYKHTGQYNLDRGHTQEPVARARFEKENGVKVFKPNCGYALEDKPFVRVNLDGVFELNGRLHILEIKSPKTENFAKLKKELPSHYIAQGQWGAGIIGAEIITYAIWSCEKDELFTVDVPFNSEAFDNLTKLADDFWFTYLANNSGASNNVVGEVNQFDGPARLDIESTACQYCVFRKTCQGLNSRGANTLEF